MSVLKKTFAVEMMHKMVTELPVKSFGLDRVGVWALNTYPSHDLILKIYNCITFQNI